MNNRLVKGILLLTLVCATLFSSVVTYKRLRANHHFDSGKDLLERSDLDGAQAQFALSLAFGRDDSDVYFLLGRAERRAGKFHDALRHLRQAEERGTVEGQVTLERMLLDAQRGELSLQVRHVLESLAHQEVADAFLIWEALAFGNLLSSSFLAAHFCTEQLVALAPADKRAWELRGLTFEGILERERAVAAYRKALAIDADYHSARRHLAAVLVSFNRHEDAAREWEILIAALPEDPSLGLSASRSYVALEQYQKALPLLEKVRTHLADDVHFQTLFGIVAWKLRGSQEATHWLERALKASPYHRDALRALADIHLERGEKESAEALLERIRELNLAEQEYHQLLVHLINEPRNPAHALGLGKLAIKMNRSAEVKRWLETALKLNPRMPEARSLLMEHEKSSPP